MTQILPNSLSTATSPGSRTDCGSRRQRPPARPRWRRLPHGAAHGIAFATGSPPAARLPPTSRKPAAALSVSRFPSPVMAPLRKPKWRDRPSAANSACSLATTSSGVSAPTVVRRPARENRRLSISDGDVTHRQRCPATTAAVLRRALAAVLPVPLVGEEVLHPREKKAAKPAPFGPQPRPANSFPAGGRRTPASGILGLMRVAAALAPQTQRRQPALTRRGEPPIGAGQSPALETKTPLGRDKIGRAMRDARTVGTYRTPCTPFYSTSAAGEPLPARPLQETAVRW